MISASQQGSEQWSVQASYRNFENSRIGKYFVWNCIDQGGQGSVYRGWDPELQREVAIKIGNEAVHDELDSLDEGVLLARINSPFVADVFDTGVYEGYPFLVMEYVSGFNLYQVVASRQLTSKEVVRIISQVAQAVRSAHACGVLHLDLKPENVMLSSGNKVKLIDFGASWRIPLRGDDFGEPGFFTEEFAAPEQIVGDMEPVDVRTDIYGMGALLWFLLTGEPPQPWNVERQTRTVTNARKRQLLNVASRCLSQTRAARFQDVDGFLLALKTRDRRSALMSIGLGFLSILIAVFLTTATTGIPDQASDIPKNVTNLEVIAPSTSESTTYIYLWTATHGLRQLETTQPDAARPKIHRFKLAELPDQFAVLTFTSAGDPVAVEQAAKLACGISKSVLERERITKIVLNSDTDRDSSPAAQAIVDCLSKHVKAFHIEMSSGTHVPSICVNLVR